MATLATINRKKNEIDAALRDDVEQLDDDLLAILIDTYLNHPERVACDPERIRKAAALAGALLYKEWLRRREVCAMEIEE